MEICSACSKELHKLIKAKNNSRQLSIALVLGLLMEKPKSTVSIEVIWLLLHLDML